MINKMRIYVWLLGINLFISSFTFGGGYVVAPIIRKYFIQKKGLFDEEDLAGMTAVAQSTPGAVAINLSALAGFKTAGAAGAVISCVAAVIPPLVILSAISVWYAAFCANPVIASVLRGMQAGVAALIVDLVTDLCVMVVKKRSWLLTAMIPAAFLASFLWEINVALILIVCCALCAARVWRAERRKR